MANDVQSLIGSEQNRIMHIELNGQSTQMEESCSIKQMLEKLELHEKRLAVEVNQEVIPRAEHDDFQLSAGDRVEIIQAVGGG